MSFLSGMSCESWGFQTSEISPSIECREFLWCFFFSSDASVLVTTLVDDAQASIFLDHDQQVNWFSANYFFASNGSSNFTAIGCRLWSVSALFESEILVGDKKYETRFRDSSLRLGNIWQTNICLVICFCSTKFRYKSWKTRISEIDKKWNSCEPQYCGRLEFLKFQTETFSAWMFRFSHVSIDVWNVQLFVACWRSL